jgi:hypothetical protein
MGLLWQNWILVSEGSTAPGGSVTAVPFEGTFALFISNPDGYVYTIKATPGFGWRLVQSNRRTLPGAPITALYDGSIFTLFMADENGEVCTTAGLPYQVQDWQEWIPVSEGSTAPGGSVVALPWDDSFALFIADPNGAVYTIRATPGFGWTLTQLNRRTMPGAPITAYFDGAIFTLFMADETGEVVTTRGIPYQGNWPEWTAVAEGSTTPGALVTAIQVGDKFVLFISDPNGAVYTSDTAPGFWTPVQPGRRTKPGGQVSVLQGPTMPPGSISQQEQMLLFMVDTDGNVSYTSGAPPNWELWATVSNSVSNIQSVPGAAVTAIGQVFGSGEFAVFSSQTVFVANSAGEVSETITVPPLILFESNFETTPANQPPSEAQAVGTASFNGPNLVISPIFQHDGNWLQIGPLSQAGGQFIANCIAAPSGSAGVYSLSAMMFMSSQSAESYIGFGSNVPFPTLFFADNNEVQAGFGQPTGCTFPRDQPFLVEVFITVGSAPSTAQIVVNGTSGNYALNVSPSSIYSVTFALENPGGSGFDVADIVVTYTAAQ